jgi:predicted ATPase
MNHKQQFHHDNFFVITGGPGVGKTTLLEELKKHGFDHVPEIARQLIKEQVEINGEALPWKNAEQYLQLQLERSIESYELANQESTGIIFFDRGILDAFCYARLINAQITEEMQEIAKRYRYNQIVFILPPWCEIYETDLERKQSWREAALTYEKMVETYENFGYELINVPTLTVEKRVDFILSHAMLNDIKYL